MKRLFVVTLTLMGVLSALAGLMVQYMPVRLGDSAIDTGLELVTSVPETSSATLKFIPPEMTPAPVELLKASPFDPSHTPFTRQKPVVPPPAKPSVTWRPELVGIIGKGESRRALIIWHPERSEAEAFVPGSETPWGKVDRLSDDEVTIGGRRIGLFD